VEVIWLGVPAYVFSIYSPLPVPGTEDGKQGLIKDQARDPEDTLMKRAMAEVKD
jgi:hypothetical protein